MKIDHVILMKEFYELNKDTELFQGVSLPATDEICKSPFTALKTEISTGNCGEVRFKYFGVFRVYPSKAKYFITTLAIRLASGVIKEKYATETTNKLKAHLDGVTK